MERTNWDLVITECVDSLENFFEPRDIKPSARTMFYRLYSLGLLPNTTNSYKGLIHHLVDARKEGLISFEAFSDGAKRTTINNEHEFVRIDNNNYAYKDFRNYVDPVIEAEAYLKYVRKLQTEDTYKMHRWYGQPNYVEVWIEKDAMASTFDSFLGDAGVNIAVNKGYSSWTFLYENAQRLKRQQDAGKNVTVLYSGDYDPSGLDMQDGHLKDALAFFGLEDVEIKRISVTLEQIKEFELPEIPNEQETIEKALRDPRYSKFVAEHGRLILVELDAMLAIAPDPFKEIIQDSVSEYFDEDVYQETLELQSSNAKRFRGYMNEHITIK